MAEERTMFNLKYIPLCNEPDPETGCRFCGERTEYEQCRQTYYLKKQAELLEKNQASQGQNTTNQEEIIKELQTENQLLKELLEKQNNQTSETIQGMVEQKQEINTLTASLQGAKTLNIAMLIIFGVAAFCLAFLYFKRKKKL